MKIEKSMGDFFSHTFEYIQMKLILISFMIAGFTTLLHDVFNVYFLDDVDFILAITILAILDCVSGIIKAVGFDKQKFNVWKLLKIWVKLFACICILIIAHVFGNLVAHGDSVSKTLLNDTARGTCICYLSGSILPNLHVITGEKMPIGWLIKLIDYSNSKLNNIEIDIPSKKAS